MPSLLDAIRRVRSTQGRFQPDGDPGPPVELAGKRVLLVYLFAALGDAILLAPVVKALLDGGAKSVGLLLRPSAARAFGLVDLKVKLHLLPELLDLPPEREGEKRSPWRKKEVKAAAADFARALADRKYDVAVDLTFRNDADARRFVRASGAPVRLGWVHTGETAADAGLTHGTEDCRHQAERHWSRYNMLPLRCLGVHQPAYDVPLAARPAAQARALALYGEGRPRVLLVPGARAEVKRWHPDRFVEVGAWVAKELGGRVVVAGAPAEAPLVKDLARRIGPRAKAYAGKDLGTLLALVQSAGAVVTNDTGPMHLAFLAKRPTVAVFTWMSRVCWGPPAADPRFVVLTAPESERSGAPSDAESIWTRAVIHYLDGLLAAHGPRR